MNQEDKKKIDAMDYEALLRGWRFHKVGEALFQGEVGKYYQKRMYEQRLVIGNDEAVRISKLVGWDKK